MRYNSLDFYDTHANKQVRYRIQFIARNALAFDEKTVGVKSAAAAIELAGKLAWPSRAVALRIIDLDGQEIYRIYRDDIH